MAEQVRPILAGIETEYGLAIVGRGAVSQVEDSAEFVSALSEGVYVGWDYSFESPRQDIRGFVQDRLATDPNDAQFDRPTSSPEHAVRSDRVLPNGARFYNDHGHPEYASPECWGLHELALHDLAGQQWVRAASQEYQARTGRPVSLYKNNSDGHGASYGTHENYLVPRSVPVPELVAGLLPMLIARQVLCGAGKVGSENGDPCEFQISQRADFFTETASVDTLFKRPVFNTRDEPHADRNNWVRLHVISGDANMMPAATARKAGLVKIALALAEAGECPQWTVADPAKAMQSVSRGLDGGGRIDLAGASWTTPRFVIESYLDAFDRRFEDPELTAVSEECRNLLDWVTSDHDKFARHVDWAAKRAAINMFLDEESAGWDAPVAKALDLAYHDIDPDVGLFQGLVESGLVEPLPAEEAVELRMNCVCEPNRALARSAAVRRFSHELTGVSWGRMSFGETQVTLPPELLYTESVEDSLTVSELIETIRNLQ